MASWTHWRSAWRGAPTGGDGAAADWGRPRRRGPSREVTIVGAGPVGLLLAILLTQRRYRVTVLEARPDPRLNPVPGGRSINLTLAERGWQALGLAGVDAPIRALSMPLGGRMIHAEDGTVRFQRYTPGGDAIFSASRAQLTLRLLGLADAHPGIRIRFGVRCQAVDLEGRMLELVTPRGPAIAQPARVLAADGAFSAVRRSLLKDPDFRFYQRLSPISYRELRIPAPPGGGFAYAEEALHIWPRGDCMIVGFPNIDRSFTISVFMPAHGALSFASLSERETLDRFLFGSCGDLAVNLENVAHHFFSGAPAPLLSCGCAPWVHGGWLGLIGDAAHTLVPFLGQGLNAGFEDCSVLMECLDETAHDWPDALGLFEERRLPDADAVTTLAEQHFDELARAARDPAFVRRKRLEERLHELAPDRFVPLYTMVAFERRPYTEIARVRERHEAILDQLMAVPRLESRWDHADVRALVEQQLATLEPAGDATRGAPAAVAE
jgi:kynurenine 3-monooxygenase